MSNFIIFEFANLKFVFDRLPTTTLEEKQMRTCWPAQIAFNSIQFKVLFRVDINHTYNTSSNELLKSTMVYNNTYNHAYKH